MIRVLRKVSINQALLIYMSLFILMEKYCFLYFFEGALSAFISGEYMPLSSDYALLDMNFLLMPILSWLNSFFKGFQLYGYFVYALSFIAAMQFLRILKVLEEKYKRDFFLIGLGFVAFQACNLIILSITKVTFILAINFFILYHFRISSQKRRITIYVLCLIFRIDLIVLLSIGYFILDTILTKRYRMKSILIAIYAISFFAVYNIIFTYYAPQPFKTLYYNELNFGDKNNIDYENLSETQALIISMAKRGVIDESMLDQSFIDSILYSKSFYLVNVILTPELFINVFKNSLSSIYNTRFLLFFCVFLIVLLYRKQVFRDRIIRLLIFLFPLLICFYISLPDRFILPYYSFYALFLISSFQGKKNTIFFSVIFVVIQLQYSSMLLNLYNEISQKFIVTMSKAKSIEDVYGSPLVFENVFYSDLTFFNPDISYRYTGREYLFFNMGFFQAPNSYQELWRSYECANPLSIKEKVITTQRLKKPIIFGTQENYEYFVNYMKKRYFMENEIYHIIVD